MSIIELGEIDMIKLPEMIDYFRKQHDLTLEELGEKLGKTKSAMSRWIGGDRSPMVTDLVRLAELFQTDITTLVFGIDATHTKPTRKIDSQTQELVNVIKQLNAAEKNKTIAFAQNLINSRTTNIKLFPVQTVEAVAAGIGYSYGNNETVTYYTSRDDLKNYDIASLVSGDSMQPDIQNGDVILIQKDAPFISGQLYAVDYDEKSYVKKVYFEKDNLRLVSTNEKYEDILIPLNTDNYLNVVGRVVDWFTPVTI